MTIARDEVSCSVQRSMRDRYSIDSKSTILHEPMSQKRADPKITIRSLEEHELPEADRIFRLAFGTFLGLPDPRLFMGDADMVRTRWLTDSSAALGAFLDSALVGSNFDLKREILSVAEQNIGETVLIHEGGDLAGFAICHLGKGSEAGSGAAYMKFGAVHPGPNAARSFTRLLAACEVLANTRGLAKLVAGVNTARHAAYQIMLQQGFKTMMQGVAMQSPNEPGYNRPDRFVVDDWR
jgi:hypothetical protein